MECTGKLLDEMHYASFKKVTKDSKVLSLHNVIKMDGDDNNYLVYSIFQLKTNNAVTVIGLNLSLLEQVSSSDELDDFGCIFDFINIDDTSVVKQEGEVNKDFASAIQAQYRSFEAKLLPEKQTTNQPQETQSSKPLETTEEEPITPQAKKAAKGRKQGPAIARRSTRAKKSLEISDEEDTNKQQPVRRSPRAKKPVVHESDNDVPPPAAKRKLNNNNNEALAAMAAMNQQLSTLTTQHTQMFSKIEALQAETIELQKKLSAQIANTSQTVVGPPALPLASPNPSLAQGQASTFFPSVPMQQPWQTQSYQLQAQPIIVVLPQTGPDPSMMQFIRQIQQIQYR